MKDLRKSKRVVINLKPAGVMKLILEEKVKDIQYIGDMSPFGIMVQLNYPVPINAEVGLVYTLDNINLEILGTVKWSKVIGGSPENKLRSRTLCQLGISFSPQNMKENLDFFNSLASC